MERTKFVLLGSLAVKQEEYIEDKFTHIDSRLDSIDGKLDAILQRLTGLNDSNN